MDFIIGEYDFECGLQFNRMRYYSPSLGRFIYKDPFTSLNYYLSFKNNPLQYEDPLGLRCTTDTLIYGPSCTEACTPKAIWECYKYCEKCCRKQTSVGRATFALGGWLMGGILGAIVGGVGGAVVTTVFLDSCIEECQGVFDPTSSRNCQPSTQPPPGSECPKDAPNCDPIT